MDTASYAAYLFRTYGLSRAICIAQAEGRTDVSNLLERTADQACVLRSI